MWATMGGTVTAHELPARAGVRSTRHRRARVVVVTVALLAALACGGVLRPAPAAAGVDDSIAAALSSAGLARSGTGVYVWDLDAARPVFELNPSTELAPASNMKLVTSAAALRDWTAAHQFATELYATDVAITAGGVLDGDIYLRGLGDPSLSTRAYQREAFDFTTASFETFAKTLKREGIRKISGRVHGDASWFDKLTTVPYWKDGLQLECGPLSGLSGNQGLDDGNRVKAPATWAAKLMTTALRNSGVKVKGKPGSGPVPTSAKFVKRQYSATLPRILGHMNKESDNFFAEMLLKGLGKDFYGDGTTAAGTKASKATLRAMGVEPGTYVIQDGSGLSYGDRLTAEGVVTVLGAMRQRDDFDAYYESLPVAGEDGTLDDRMRGTAAAGNAHAKTGTLNIAVCLSGYVESANDHLVGFSILMNGGSMGTTDWGRAATAQDKIVAALAKASLPGKPVLAVTPVLRQHSVSAVETVHGVGGRLRPVVQP
jgi:D-alanyl-D-alanine carboxypeptidase/D-alanyl-D-alanine-endopeptidase (penicillin-binding protein 4)